MSVFARGFICLVAALAGPSEAHADAIPVCAGRDLSANLSLKPDFEFFNEDLLNSDGLLWKIEKSGIAPSYLYGTIHSTQAVPVAMARKAAEKLDAAKIVATELGGPFDASAQVTMSSALLNAAIAPDEDTFAQVFTVDEVALVQHYLDTRGYSKEMAHHLKLWFLALATSLPTCEAEGEAKGLPEVDDVIARVGISKGLAVVALETIADQLAALRAISPQLASRMLVATARSPEFVDDAYVTLLGLYERKRPAVAIAVLSAAPGTTTQDREAEREFTKKLLAGRNIEMIQRALPLIDRGGAFIAVGALHLSGTDGLVERLRTLGYKLTAEW
jgi:uncharacterized protein